jgi:hypothetical protein
MLTHGIVVVRIPSLRHRFLKQGLMVTGAGTPTFDDAIKSAHDIYGQFCRSFAEGKIENWNTSTYSEYHALDLSNRYLTPKKDAPSMAHIPFQKSVDPHGYLEGLVGTDYVHGEENEVEYYSLRIDSEGKRYVIKTPYNASTHRIENSYNRATPQMFRLGDIVEAQMSFIAIPLRGQTFKMITVLHSIALIDSTFTQVSQSNAICFNSTNKTRTTGSYQEAPGRHDRPHSTPSNSQA